MVIKAVYFSELYETRRRCVGKAFCVINAAFMRYADIRGAVVSER